MKPETLALAGVAVSSGMQALISFFIVHYAPSAGQALVWLKGSLYARSWEHVGMILPWSLVGFVLALYFWRHLNILNLKTESVIALGVRVQLIRFTLLLIVIMLAGSAVSVAGTLGFIGLVVPHAARLLIGPDHRLLIPLAALLGGLMVVGADLIGRSIFPPLEFPAGIITAMIGAPYFLFLLLRQKKL
jgi:iron complex transport system permease protein